MELAQQLIEEFVREAVKIPDDVTISQALLLARMARDPEARVRVTKLKADGYYMGSNPNYNLNRLLKMAYVTVSDSTVDKRIKLVKLTREGLEFGSNVAMQLNFVEEQIGNLFDPEAFRRARAFMGETVFGAERPKSEPPVRQTA